MAEETVEGPPSRRANATLVASPVSDHLFLFGGENYDGQRVEMYADVSHFFPLSAQWRHLQSASRETENAWRPHFPLPLQPRKSAAANLTGEDPVQMYRYDPSKNEWRKFSSPTQPGPRAAHQMVGTVAGGGRLWVHGGEYCEWHHTWSKFPGHRSVSAER